MGKGWQSTSEGMLSGPREDPTQRNKGVDILGFFRDLWVVHCD